MADELDRLRHLGGVLVDPDEESVRRARSLLERMIDLPQSQNEVSAVRDRGFNLGSRRALLLITASLLVASALGFGLASSLTPSGNAGVNFVGFGFRPVSGWSVLQTGVLDESGVATAVAANVQLGAGDDLGGPPRATLASLPDRGVLIFATFKLSRASGLDAAYQSRELPLQLQDGERLPAARGSLGGLAQYRVRAAVDGYDIDARVYFGQLYPSPAAFVAAQAQLNRLVVTAERLTLRVRPTVIGARARASRVRVSGTVEGARAGEPVAIQGKTCGLRFFRVIGGAVTEADGSWWNYVYPSKLTTLRAVWRDQTSAEVTVRVQAFVNLRPKSGRRIEVSVWGSSFWRKQVAIQRFDNRLGTWAAIASVVLADSEGQRNIATFVPRVPKGTLIRAVFPRSRAAPCYLAGISNSMRT